MGKRKKKRRKDIAISAFGLSGAADQYETAPLYQSRFQESDMIWLADEYRERSRSEPSLMLEDFAVQYGVSGDELRSHVSELSREIDRSVTLWHGTTVSRARSILKEGFRAKKARNQKGRMFFAARPSMARGIAQARASGNDPPAVLMCSIDLSHYDQYERRGNDVYVFRHNCIASEVVQKMERLPGQRREKSEKIPKKRKDASVKPTDIALTFNSGRAGIAYWINSCLNLDDTDRIQEDYEAVEKIKQWLDDQVDAGRFGAVPNDEMLEQVRKILPLRVLRRGTINDVRLHYPSHTIC